MSQSAAYPSCYLLLFSQVAVVIAITSGREYSATVNELWTMSSVAN